MAIKIRPNPAIPDHEVLRKIGGGAYGEVWLARGVTGALRAVKVVWREDFEDARSFEREFEGILKFEPMSRDHPALVNILHVGRSPDGVSFYYYVMELGDDVTSGQDINPIEYEPRTLRADNPQATGVQWSTSDCIDVGLRLAEALDHLHERGLAHRDVKPSNVIFVNGRAKLADIGLVATRGQRTFVGTEGFVPPEGPGSSQADVYSLGKVLYEIATGKDRLSFPELPEVMPTGVDRKRWLELNRIICDICEPRISKRKISSAADLADALRRLQRGKHRRQSGLAVWMTTFLLTGFCGWAAWEMLKGGEWLESFYPTALIVPPQTGTLRVVSIPEGADVFDVKSGRFYGTTNNVEIPVTVGDSYELVVKKSGFSNCLLDGRVLALTDAPLLAEMKIYSPPQAGEPWKDHLGNIYQPVGTQHESSGFVRKINWQKFIQSNKRAMEVVKFSQNGQPIEIVVCKPDDAVAYCEWLRQSACDLGYLTDNFEVYPLIESSFENPELSERARKEGMKPFRVAVRRISFGEIAITTEPSGVEVYISPISSPNNQLSVGSTNNSLEIPDVKPGTWRIYLVREGYKPLTIDVQVADGERVARTVRLDKSEGVIFGKAWENGIGMRFAPMGQDLMASIWETRVKDYQRFIKESNPRHAGPKGTEFPQSADQPVVFVSREDAQAFCVWLTEKERKDERIAQTHVYRLPTDLEWSNMVGLREDPELSPGWRHARKQQTYPWGDAWLQRSGLPVGNYADVSASRAPGVAVDRTIPDYDDGFPHTAPVGSFPPNSLGLYDLGGNVQEWVEDEYSQLGKSSLGVLRGGGWSSYQAEDLFSGSRNPVPPTYQDAIYGFRVVLAKVPPKAEDHQ